MILLLGASGYVGRAFSSELRRRRWSFIPLSRQAIDYTSFDVLFEYAVKMKPEFVINAAGCAPDPMDPCEPAREEVLCANALLPQTIARVCLMTNTPWGHVSAGSIYIGAKVMTESGHPRIERDLNRPEIRALFARHPERIRGFTEWDEPNFTFRVAPCNFYSGTKALAEEAIHGMGEHYIWRPWMLFDGADDSSNLIAKLLRHDRIYDSINSITQLDEFVRACLDLWERRAAYGVYNVVNTGAITTRRIVELVRKYLKPDRDIKFRERDEKFYNGATEVPWSHCVLDVSKLLAAGVKMRPVEEALTHSLKNWQRASPSWGHSTAGAETRNNTLNEVAVFDKMLPRPI